MLPLLARCFALVVLTAAERVEDDVTCLLQTSQRHPILSSAGAVVPGKARVEAKHAASRFAKLSLSQPSTSNHAHWRRQHMQWQSVARASGAQDSAVSLL